MKKLIFAVLLGILFVPDVYAGTEADDSGLPVPRMVSLRSSVVNARSGPGARYPIEWVYRQEGAPVEIIAEFEFWRKIKDWEGTETWVHKAMLSGERTIKMTAKGESNIYARPDYNSRVIAKTEDQVIGKIEECPAGSAFCRIRFGSSVEGWVPRRHFFGVYSGEEI